MENMEKNVNIKRVLMTVDAVGGVWTYAIELARQFKKMGIEVIFALMGPASDRAQKEMISTLDNVELIESKYKLEWMDDPWGDVDEAADWLLELEILAHPDIIHLNGYSHAALPWHAPVVIVAHSCVCSWYESVYGTSLPDKNKEYKRRICQGLMAAEHVVAPSNTMLQALYRNYGQTFCSSVIYNGNETVNEIPGLKETFILTCGRIWDNAKNIKMVAEIAEDLPWTVYGAGDVLDNKEFEYKNYKTLGKLSHSMLQSLMSRAPIFVLPAKYEPFGLSILEAAKAGCVLVLGNIDSLKEIWSDAAIYVNPNDSQELKKILNECIKSSSLRKEYSNRAKNRSSCFSAETMADKYLKLYKSMIINKSKYDNNPISVILR